MAYCTNCGQEILNGSNFCSNCGTSVNSKSSTMQRKTVYEGSIHKCPNCGESIPSFVINCPSCGHEFRGVTATSSVNELSRKLEEIENKRIYRKPKTFHGKMYGTKEMTETDEQKINLIRNFAIPNTKEDLFEFIILAESNIYVDLYNTVSNPVMPNDSRKELSNAWEAKFEQAYNKAKYLFGEKEEFKAIGELYANNKAKISKAKRKARNFYIYLFGGLAIVWTILILLAVKA